MLSEGTIVGDRWRIERLIGVGGLSQVWLVRHVELGSVQALKLMTVKRPRLGERLLREGRIQAQLRHPHIVPVRDVVRHEGYVGLLMDYVEGAPLDTHLASLGAMPLEDALTLIAPVLGAVAAAHDAGVLHRDIKPANILLARTTQGFVPKVADFGIAKLLEEDDGNRHTRSGAVMGTPGYLAPEQADDASTVDARADVFALGAVFYEMVTGRRAYDGESLDARLSTPPPRLDVTVPGTPTHVADAVHKAIAPEAAQRFDDIRTFAAALMQDAPYLLAQVAASATPSPTPTPPVVPPPPPTQAPQPSDTTEAPITSDDRGRSGLIPLLLIAGGILVWIGATMVFGWPPDAVVDGDAPPPAEASPTPAAAQDVAPTREAAPTAPPTPEDAPLEEDVPSADDALPVDDDATTDAKPSAAARATPPPAAPAAEPRTASEPAAEVAEPSPAAEDAEPPSPDEAPSDDGVAIVADDAPADDAKSPPPAEPKAPEGAAEAEAEAPDGAPEVVAAPPVPAILGLWKGDAKGRPMRLRVLTQDGKRLSGTITFVTGPVERSYPVTGSVDAAGRLALRDAEGVLQVTGTIDIPQMRGTYTSGKSKPQPFEMRWTSL